MVEHANAKQDHASCQARKPRDVHCVPRRYMRMKTVMVVGDLESRDRGKKRNTYRVAHGYHNAMIHTV